MPDDSARTPRPEPDLAATPGDAAAPDQPLAPSRPVRSPRSKTARSRRPRKPPQAVTVEESAAPEAAEPEAATEAAGSVTAVAAAKAPVAVDPSPGHAPPDTVAPAPVEPSAAGPVTLAQALASDGVRRVIVTVSYLFSLVGALAALGVVDSGSYELSTVLTPTLSLLAAAAEADRLWWVVLLGLALYVGWLWLPGNAASPRSRTMAYPSAVSLTILGIWFFQIRSGELVSSALVSLLVVACLMWTLRAAERAPSRGFVGRQCAHLGFAAALGWMTVLSTGAIAGALVRHHVPAYFVSAETWGILGTTALLGAGMALVRYFPGRLYIAATLSWGFVWIAYARVVGQPRSYFVAVVALVSALLILIAGVAVFLWARGRVRERVG